MTDAVPTPAAESDATAQPSKPAQSLRTQKVGRVVSDKMDKTIVIEVDSIRRHPLYHKRFTRTHRFMAHDEQNSCKPGDLVRIQETRPLSKNKRWVVREIVERGIRF